ncbi:MAG: hypothetical protein GC182_20140 [Rhodopseudomonas sp.]|nr:hypothetical protein [Rhodopseudomonas sp.]
MAMSSFFRNDRHGPNRLAGLRLIDRFGLGADHPIRDEQTVTVVALVIGVTVVVAVAILIGMT